MDTEKPGPDLPGSDKLISDQPNTPGTSAATAPRSHPQPQELEGWEAGFYAARLLVSLPLLLFLSLATVTPFEFGEHDDLPDPLVVPFQGRSVFVGALTCYLLCLLFPHPKGVLAKVLFWGAVFALFVAVKVFQWWFQIYQFD